MTPTASPRPRLSLTWGERTIAYELSLEDRNDMTITVYPDLRVTVRAPNTKPARMIEERLQAKRSWIVRQLRDLEQYHPASPPRQFVGGETHWYLGRQYRLRLISGAPSVRCSAGRLIVSVYSPEQSGSIEKALKAWYELRARVVFAERLAEVQCTIRPLRKVVPRLRMRWMKKRWGSCTPTGTVTLNIELIHASKASIDYVIVHELSHLIVPAHSAKFFRILDSCMPDWEHRRRRLNQVRS